MRAVVLMRVHVPLVVSCSHWSVLRPGRCNYYFMNLKVTTDSVKFGALRLCARVSSILNTSSPNCLKLVSTVAKIADAFLHVPILAIFSPMSGPIGAFCTLAATSESRSAT